MVSVEGLEPSVSCTRGTRFGLAKLHADNLEPMPRIELGVSTLGPSMPAQRHMGDWSGWEESNLLLPRSKRGSLPVSYTQETGAHEGDRTLLHPLDRRRLSPESDVRNGSAATTALWSYAVATAARRSIGGSARSRTETWPVKSR